MDYFYKFLLLTEQVCTKNMEQFTQSYQVLFWICFHFEAMFENHFFFLR